MLTYIGQPHLAAVMPVDPTALLITAIFASKYEGCMCLPKKCEVIAHGSEKICGIKFDGGANDVDIGSGVAMPYPGSKCEFNSRGSCLRQACEGTDAYPDNSDSALGKLGRIGNNTYNCWRPFWEDFSHKPREVRALTYRQQLGEPLP